MTNIRMTNIRWLMMALIILLVLINYVDRVALAFAVGPITTNYHLSPAQWGEITSAFSIGYLVLAFVSGPVVDRFGVKRTLTGAVAVWSAAAALMACVGSFAGFFVARVLLGIGEGPGFPSATKAARTWLPRTERGRILSLIGGAGVSASILAGGPICSQLILAVGWRGMFVVLGSAGIIWLLLWIFIYHEKPKTHKFISDTEVTHICADDDAAATAEISTTATPVIVPIWRNLTLWMIGLGFFAWGYVFWGLMYWLPAFLENSYKIKLGAVGLFSILPWSAGIVGALIGGTVMDQLAKRGKRMRPTYIFMGIMLFCAGLCMIPVLLMHSLMVSLIFISLGLGFGFVTGGFWWIGCIEASSHRPGFAAGFMDACFAVSGIVAPLAMGEVVQITGSFMGGFFLMFAISIIGALALILGTRETKYIAPVNG